VTSTIRKETRV